MKLRKVFSFYCVAFLMVVCSDPSVAQTKSDDLLNRYLEPLETQADSINVMLAKISADYGIPIGLEETTDGEGTGS